MKIPEKNNRLEGHYLIILVLLTLLVPPVFAGDHTNDDLTGLKMYEYYYGSNSENAETMTAGSNSSYQSFTIGTVGANETFIVKGIGTGLFGYGGNESYTLEIFNSTNETGCIFSETVASGRTANMVMNGVYPAADFKNITLEQNGTLYQGKTYCLRIRAELTSATVWLVDRGGSYFGGMAHSNDYGNIWKDNIDNWFSIFGEPLPLTGLSIVNSRPLNNSNLTDITINFGCNSTRSSVTSLTNITSMVLNITNGSLNWLQTISSLNTPNYNATFTNSTMSMGLYNWSCTAYGDTANSTSQLFTFNRTDIPPTVNIIYPVYNQTYFTVSHFNYTFVEDSPDTCVFWNGSLNLTIICGDNVTGLNPPEGQNEWIIFINNTNGLHNIDIVNFTIHTGVPLIEYNSGTFSDGSNVSQNYFNINVTIFEPFPNNVTYRLFFSNGTILTNLSGNTSYNHTFTNLPNDLYYYNVTICDSANNCNFTRTQRVLIDYLNPVINILSPNSGTGTTNHNVNFSWNVNDYNNNTNSFPPNTTLYLPGNLSNGLLAYYPLSNNLDYSGNGNHLTSGVGTYSKGLIGNSLSNSVIYADGIFNIFNTQDIYSNMTVCLWTYKPVDDGLNSGIFGLLHGTGGNLQDGNSQFSLSYANGGTEWQLSTDSGNGGISSFGGNGGGWKLHCMTKTGNNIAYYLNNTLQSSVFYSPISPLTINEIIIGAYDNVGSLQWSGLIDEVGIWNRVLEPTEINSIYNNGTGLVYNTGSGIVNTTFRLYNGSNDLINTTTNSIFGNIFNFIISIPKVLIDGIYTFFADAYDYATNIGVSNNATIIIDSTPPMLNISYPTNTTYTTVITPYSNTTSHIDWQINDMINFSNCWYQIDNGTQIFVPCHLNTTSFPLNFSNYNITFFVNDTLGNRNYSTIFATWRYMIRSNSVSFNDLSTELTSQDFVLNTTLGSTVTGVSVILKYNNTDYTSLISNDGINTLFTNTLITPSVKLETNISFYWNITASDGVTTNSLNTILYNQTITPIEIGVCNETINQTIYNFTAYDEDTLLRIKPFYFGGDFSFSINGSIKKTMTVSNVSDEIDICINPANSIINLDVYATYDEDKNISQTYNARNYILQNHIKYNTTELVNLTLLNISKTTSFTLKVQDSDLVPLPNYIINTYRLNPSTGQFYLTQSGKTDSNGLTSGFFVINTVDYKFVITHNDVVVLETIPAQKVIPQTPPYTLVFTISPTQSNTFENLLNITNLNYTFNNISNGVQFIYTDSSGNFTRGRLTVYRINYSGQNILVCNVTSPLTTATLSCNFGGVNGTYSAIGYITRGGQEFFVDAINFLFPYGGMGWGLYGVFLGLMIILISSFAFKFNEIAGIWLVIVSIIFVQLIGFINFGLPFISGIIVVGIIITVVMKQ